MEALVYDNRIITGHKLYPVCGKKLQDVYCAGGSALRRN